MTNYIHSRSLASELPRPGLCAGWDFTGVLRDATPQCSFDYLNAQIRIDSGEGGGGLLQFCLLCIQCSCSILHSGWDPRDGRRRSSHGVFLHSSHGWLKGVLGLKSICSRQLFPHSRLCR